MGRKGEKGARTGNQKNTGRDKGKGRRGEKRLYERGGGTKERSSERGSKKERGKKGTGKSSY